MSTEENGKKYSRGVVRNRLQTHPNVILFHSPSPLTLKSIAEVQDGEPSILWGEKKISTWEKLSLGFGSSISVT